MVFMQSVDSHTDDRAYLLPWSSAASCPLIKRLGGFAACSVSVTLTGQGGWASLQALILGGRLLLHLVRLAHGLISVLFLSCLGYVYYYGVTDTRSVWLVLSVIALVGEGAAVAANGGNRPPDDLCGAVWAKGARAL